MKTYERYLEVLETFSDYVTISEWADKYILTHPNSVIELGNSEEKIKRNLTKNISSFISMEQYSNMISKDKNSKPQKIKFIPIEERDNSTHSKNTKSEPFVHMMKNLEFLHYDQKLPTRDEYSKFENTGHITGYKEYIAFEMAIRNKDVIEITQKLDYVKKIIEDFESLKRFEDWLLGMIDWEEKYEGEPPEFTIDSELKKECIFNAELQTTKFKEEIDFLTAEKKLINEKSEAAICLKIIADYLQEKLVNEYHIYKDGYYFINDGEYFDPEEVIDSDFIYKYDFNTYNLEDDIKLAIDKFINRKQNNMENTADMFFMYDYYSNRKANNTLDFYASDLKFELTKYHGITINPLKKTFSYDECLDSYEEFKDFEASFYTVEKSIANKIKLMKKFIDKRLYRFILFL